MRRTRVSTWVVAALFVAVLALYLLVRPDPAATARREPVAPVAPVVQPSPTRTATPPPTPTVRRTPTPSATLTTTPSPSASPSTTLRLPFPSPTM